MLRTTTIGARRIGAVLCLALAFGCAVSASPESIPGKTRYLVRVAVDLDAGRYSGTETVTFANTSGGKVDVLRFALYPNVGADAEPLLRVTAARVGDRELELRLENGLLRLDLPEAVGSGEETTVTLEFEGRVAMREPGEVGLERHVTDQVAIVLAPDARRYRTGADVVTAADGAMLLGNPFPVLAVLKGGDATKPTAGDFVFSESGAYRIEVTSNEGTEVVASGRDEGTTPLGARVFGGVSLRSVALFVTRGFTSLETDAAGVRLRSIHRERHAPAARRALEALRDAVAVYAERFGPPPVEEMTVVEAPLAPGTSAVAFSGLIAAASAYYTDIRGEEGRDLPGFVRDTPELMEGEIEFAVMREAARQWWGEGVGSDPRRSTVLTEGLSGYSAVIAVERARGGEAATQVVEKHLRTPYRVYRMFGGIDMPANREPQSYPNYFAYSAIVESKTGLFVRALREVLGDEKFFAVLKQYYGRNAGRIARSEDFAAALEAVTDKTDRERFKKLYDRWITQRHGDADIGEPAFAVAISPATKKAAASEPPERRSGFDRVGRFVVRMFVQIGKTAAKPF